MFGTDMAGSLSVQLYKSGPISVKVRADSHLIKPVFGTTLAHPDPLIGGEPKVSRWGHGLLKASTLSLIALK